MDKQVDSTQEEARARLRQRFGDVQRVGGKGAPRKVVKTGHKGAAGDEKKLGAMLKRLGLNTLSQIEEVSFLMADGTTQVFANPKVQASPQSKTYFVSGPSETKPFDAASVLAPIMSPEMIQKLTAQFGQQEAGGAAVADFPELEEVTNFEAVAETDTPPAQ